MSVLRAQAHVDLHAIEDNVALLRQKAGSALTMAVVKADGYGHGLLPAAHAALAGGADWLGVAVLDEALALREAGVTTPLLCWLAVPGESLADGIRHDVDLSVSSVWSLSETVAAARAEGRAARIHLKIDTGLSRNGCPAAGWAELVRAVAAAQAEGAVTAVGIWTHFAYADAPGHPTIAAQLEAFREAVDVARANGVTPQLRHVANSAATLTLPDARFDLVRPGIAVYGLSPVPEQGSFGLRPAMTLSARVALAKRMPAGTGVSYAHRYVTERETTLALVPLGYADGVPRNATNCGPVLLGGRRRTVAGTVCMDQFVVDVGDDPVAEGDEVVLFGPGHGAEPTAQDWADTVGSIHYEIVTRIGARVKRTYSGGSE